MAAHSPSTPFAIVRSLFCFYSFNVRLNICFYDGSGTSISVLYGRFRLQAERKYASRRRLSISIASSHKMMTVGSWDGLMPTFRRQLDIVQFPSIGHHIGTCCVSVLFFSVFLHFVAHSSLHMLLRYADVEKRRNKKINRKSKFTPKYLLNETFRVLRDCGVFYTTATSLQCI